MQLSQAPETAVKSCCPCPHAQSTDHLVLELPGGTRRGTRTWQLGVPPRAWSWTLPKTLLGNK